jgi:hypothetical protein
MQREKLTKDGGKVDRMLYAGNNNLERARDIFAKWLSNTDHASS